MTSKFRNTSEFRLTKEFRSTSAFDQQFTFFYMLISRTGFKSPNFSLGRECLCHYSKWPRIVTPHTLYLTSLFKYVLSKGWFRYMLSKCRSDIQLHINACLLSFLGLLLSVRFSVGTVPYSLLLLYCHPILGFM